MPLLFCVEYGVKRVRRLRLTLSPKLILPNTLRNKQKRAVSLMAKIKNVV
jgi:hypothetical protein